jgi:hypothetical protein
VHKVGFVFTSDAELTRLNLTSPVTVQGRKILPTAVVEFGGEKQLCRLSDRADLMGGRCGGDDTVWFHEISE